MLDELVSYIDAEGGMAYSSQLKGAGFSAGLISMRAKQALLIGFHAVSTARLMFSKMTFS